MDESFLNMVRSASSVDVHNSISKERAEIFKALVTCDSSHSSLLLIMGRAIQLNIMEKHLISNNKEQTKIPFKEAKERR